MQSKLACHMAEFNPHELKRLEDSGRLQEYLEERSSQASLVNLQCCQAGMSSQQAGEVANEDLYPEPETGDGDDEDSEA
jgi:hypothetical protein